MVRSLPGRTEVGRLKSPGCEADIGGMAPHDLPVFDPGIIERYVENTYRKANAVFLGSVVAGVMFGAAFGATPLTSLGANWPIPRMFGFATMIVGAIVGGVIAMGMILVRGQFRKNLFHVREIVGDLTSQSSISEIHARANSRRSRWHRLPYGVPLCIGFLGYLFLSGLV